VANRVTTGSAVASTSEWTLNGTEESLCITNDSKVGVGIANPQRALEVAGDLVVSGTISGGAGMGAFRNRIINGDMRIAQRGTSNVLPYVNSVYVYLIDRFAVLIAGPATSGTVTQYQTALGASETPYQNGLRYYANVTVNISTNASAMVPGQIIEGFNIQDFNWGTSFGSPVTISFWFRTNAPVGSLFSYSLVNYSYGFTNFAGAFTIASSGTWQYYTFTVPPPPNGSAWNTGSAGSLAVYIVPYYNLGYTSTINAWNAGTYTYIPYGAYPWPTITGSYIHFTGVQLEKGTVATPFEFRPYATELALCQRYFTQLGGQSVYNFFGSGLAMGGTFAYIIVPLPTNLRSPSGSTLTVNNVGGFQLTGNVAGASSSIVATAITLPASTQNINSILLTITVASGLGTNWPYVLNTNNNLLSYIQINNEL
jgi:hypothetical protein